MPFCLSYKYSEPFCVLQTGTETRKEKLGTAMMAQGGYSTIEDCIGNTPLVRLQRLSSNPSNVILAKLEGNNPAGSVKDR